MANTLQGKKIAILATDGAERVGIRRFLPPTEWRSNGQRRSRTRTATWATSRLDGGTHLVAGSTSVKGRTVLPDARAALCVDDDLPAVTVARASIQPPRLGMKGESYADCKFETA